MGKIGIPSNSNISKNDSTETRKQHQSYPFSKASHLPANYMNSKRKLDNYKNMYSKMYPDHNYLHLNSLWSIWYGVLLTLIQGYLAVHGASRFLGCSLIPWRIEPVAELNFQIILSGLVFVLLPFFFTSAVFKVGNMANDGIKLGSVSKERLCSMISHDVLEEESCGGTLRTLWTHGCPTAAFIHILIAICLLLPRLLLEGRIIENGLLPKETIWQTELDFVAVNRRNLVMLSFKSSRIYNSMPIELQEDENYINDTVFPVPSRNYKNNTTYLYDNFEQIKRQVEVLNGKVKYFELSDLVGATINPNKVITKYGIHKTSTISPIFIPNFTYEESNMNITTSKTIISTTGTNEVPINMYEGIGTSTNGYLVSTHSIQEPNEISNNFSKPVSFPISNLKSMNKQHHILNHDNHKVMRKHHRQRKIVAALAQDKNYKIYSVHQKPLKSRRLKDLHEINYDFNDHSISFGNLDKINFPKTSTGKVYDHTTKSYDILTIGHTRTIYPESSTATSTTTLDSNIHIFRPGKFPEVLPSTPVSSNSKIIEIKQKTNEIKREISSTGANLVEMEPEYVADELSLNDSIEVNSVESSASSGINATLGEYNIRLDGFAGMLQFFFGVEKPIDVKTFRNPPSAEFVNLLFAIFVWCVRYPAVFWTTTKSFATIFSMQMIASAADIIFSFVGVSSLIKLHIYSQRQPIQMNGLILNASVTLALYLLSVILIVSSSMVLYLYGYRRLSSKIRDRSLISLNTNEPWTNFAHCASLSYVLALCVVKAPLLNDFSATYRYNSQCSTFMAVLVSIVHLFLWIIVWICLAVKRKWSFKLSTLDSYTIIRKDAIQPLLMHNTGYKNNTNTKSVNNINTTGVTRSSASENIGNKQNCRNSKNLVSNTSSSGVLNDELSGDVYWPKVTPTSPKLKVTFNEVTSTFDDGHNRLIGEHEQKKSNPPHGNSICFASIEGQIDDGEYATLKSGATTETIFGIALDDCSEPQGSFNISQNHILTGDVKGLHLKEYDGLPSPPANMTSSMTITNHTTTVTLDSRNTYENVCNDRVDNEFGDDNISDKGKLLESVRHDCVTYASTCDLEPPLLLPSPKAGETNHNVGLSIFHSNKITNYIQLSSPDCFISPLAPVRVSVHTNEAHIAPSSTPRCLRRGDSGVPQEALTPRSDTNSYGTESTISPPEQAPSESSSGVHSAEERDVELIIRPRISGKHIAKLPSAIQEEPNGRCTNMRMSSFTGACSTNSATLPIHRSNTDQKFDYSLHCTTMPLPINSHNHNEEIIRHNEYITSDHCISKTQSTRKNVSSFKTPLYANSGVISANKQMKLQDQRVRTRCPSPSSQQIIYGTLTSGTRYSNPNILRRHPFNKATDFQYSHQTLSNGFDNSLVNSTVHGDRDSANYSMISEQESLYSTANSLH